MVETKILQKKTTVSLIAYLHTLILYQNIDVLFIYQYGVSRAKLEPWSKPRKELL